MNDPDVRTLVDFLHDHIVDNPNEWQASEYQFWNKEHNVSFWIGNGFFHFRREGGGKHLGFMNKIRLWYAYKHWCNDIKRVQ